MNLREVFCRGLLDGEVDLPGKIRTRFERGFGDALVNFHPKVKGIKGWSIEFRRW